LGLSLFQVVKLARRKRKITMSLMGNLRNIIVILALVWTAFGWTAWAREGSCPPVISQPCHLQYDHVLWSVAFSPDGTRLAAGAGDGTIRLWDAATGRVLRPLGRHTGDVWAVAFSPDGRILASASFDGTVKLWEAGTGRLVATLRGHEDFVRAVAFSPDGRILASGSKDHTIILWEVATGKKLRTLRGHTDWLNSLAFSPDGKLLASGSLDRGFHDTVKLWEVATGRELRTLWGHTKHVWSVAFSPDGQLLASASSDGTVKLWDVSTGEAVRTLRGHEGFVRAVAFSPDGRLLASGSSDGTVRLWNAANGSERLVLGGLPGEVRSVALSPDGRYLAAVYCAKRGANGCFRGAVALWPLPEVLSQAGFSSLEDFDADGDSRLNDGEFFAVIDAWVVGQIDDRTLFQAIDLWVSGARRLIPASAAKTRVIFYRARRVYLFTGGDPEVRSIRVEVYSLDGRRVFVGEAAGPKLLWNLRTAEGRPVANGIYLYVVMLRSSDGHIERREVRKLMVVRG
jgi:dipeptidyl aminopeptidase/acylaminoacyl peptidase